MCNGCGDLMQKGLSFDDIAIVSVKGNDYKIHFWYMSKDEAINLLRIYWFKEKNRNIKKYKFSVSYILGFNEIEKWKFYSYKNPVFLKGHGYW